jgi:hypothetical protein
MENVAARGDATFERHCADHGFFCTYYVGYRSCRARALKNGRCRMHGGKAGRKPTHRRYTRAAIAERRGTRAPIPQSVLFRADRVIE